MTVSDRVQPKGRVNVGAPSHSTGLDSGVRRLFDKASIRTITLKRCSAESDVTDEQPLNLGVGWQASGQRTSDSRKFTATVQFKLEGTPLDDPASRPKLIIEATFYAMYEAPSELELDDSEALDLFARTNGVWNLWPYWREFVQTITVRMGLPALTVPSYRVEEAFSGPGTSPRSN